LEIEGVVPQKRSRDEVDAVRRERPHLSNGCAGHESDNTDHRGHRSTGGCGPESRTVEMTSPGSPFFKTGMALGALAILLISVCMGAAIGETAIPIATVAQTIANRLWGAGYAVSPLDEGIVWSYRLS
ncbi:hypothetical protein QU39_00035, partial [Staphylococcus aureus]